MAPRQETASTDMSVAFGDLVDDAIALGVLLALSVIMLLITWAVIMPLLRRVIKKTNFEWDDVFLDAKTFRWLAYIPPAVVFALASKILESDYLPFAVELQPGIQDILQHAAQAFMVLCLLMATNASLTAVNIIYRKKEAARSRPIKGFIQLGKITVTIIGSICAIGLLFGQAPWGFLKYAAGGAAVLMFVFKDTILSLVASIQLTTNDMLRVGDWVEVPSCGADGDVTDIALHTVTIQNFDKTIVTVPTQSLVNGAFKNWRGMQDSGGRRIKRDIYVDMSTVRFLDDSDIERFGKIDLLANYIAEKKQALTASNEELSDSASAIDSRRLTNIGTFRAYVIAYLRARPEIHREFTFLIRQLQPGPTGVPIQIYIFLNTTAWVAYESIQSDIFDHLLAALGEFGLQVFQQPTSHAVASLAPGQG